MQLDEEAVDKQGSSSADTYNSSDMPAAVAIELPPSRSPGHLNNGSPEQAWSPRISSPLNPHHAMSASPPLSPPYKLKRRPSQLSNFVGYTPTQAEARLVESREDTVELSSLLGPDDRLRFFRCLDNNLLPALIAPAERANALRVMETMLVLLENALNKGLGEHGDHKFLQIKLSNPTIRTKLDLDGPASKQKGAPSLEYLHLCGWKHKVESFQEYLHYPANPQPKTLAELRTGHRILATRVAKEQEDALRSSERQANAKKEESDRVKNALSQIREDREKMKEVAERERLARAARAAATSPRSSTAPLSPGATSPRQSQ